MSFKELEKKEAANRNLRIFKEPKECNRLRNKARSYLRVEEMYVKSNALNALVFGELINVGTEMSNAGLICLI